MMPTFRVWFVASAILAVAFYLGIRWAFPVPLAQQSGSSPPDASLKDPTEPFDAAIRNRSTPQDGSIASESDSMKIGLISRTLDDRRPNELPADGYVGSSSCRECHAGAHASWHASFHRTMTQEVNSNTVPAGLLNQTVVVQGRKYVFEQSGDGVVVIFSDPLANYQVRRRQLVLMTGSHHMNVFWYETEVHGTPGQLDIVYLLEDQKWIPRDSSFIRPQTETNEIELGTWNRTCSRCHATHAKEGFNPKTEDWDTVVAEFGIACEACHGEGAGHVKRHVAAAQDADEKGRINSLKPIATTHSLKASDDADDDKIVNPAKLSKQASSAVCGQCHSIFVPNYDALSESDYMRDGSSFRPGELLEEDQFIQVVRATSEHRDQERFKRWISMESIGSGYWSDGTPRIAGREYNGLIESPCYINGEMTCLSCHTMHSDSNSNDRLMEWRDDQLKPGMRGDQACLQCHKEYELDIEKHSHHSPQSEGSRCMNCHMPHTTFGLLKTNRSHQISSPSVRASQTSDRPDACSLCHLDRSFNWVSERLADWYGQPVEQNTQAGETQAVATSILHLLSGDAAQRAIQVSAMGRESAQLASGNDWLEPYLLLGLNDPYDAVRIVASRSLKTLPQRLSDDMDPLAPPIERMNAFNASITKIVENTKMSARPAVLVDEQGRLDFAKVRALLDLRNHRPVYLHE